jgi:hypothetical protein
MTTSFFCARFPVRNGAPETIVMGEWDYDFSELIKDLVRANAEVEAALECQHEAIERLTKAWVASEAEDEDEDEDEDEVEPAAAE